MLRGFSENISHLRREKKMSQRTVANLLGISQALLSHYENGLREPGLEFVVSLAKLYEVSCDYLLGTTKAPQPSALLAKSDYDDIAKQLDFLARQLSPQE